MAENKELMAHAAIVLGDLLTESAEICGTVVLTVEPQEIHAALGKLRDNPATQLDVLRYMTAVDYQPREPRFEVVYELYSTNICHGLRVKAKLAEPRKANRLPEVDSVSNLFLTADWHERECYDLMGIWFNGHPDLRRILLPDGWDGHPLRKEYPFDGKKAWALGCTVKEEMFYPGSDNL